MGGTTVAELQDRMGYSEFVQWMAFYQTESFGESRSDLRNAQLMMLLANINRDTQAKPFQVRDFLPEYWQAERPAQQGLSLLQKFKMAIGKA